MTESKRKAPEGTMLEHRHIAQGKDLAWQAAIFHAEMDKLGVPRDDGEDFYSLWGRVDRLLAGTSPSEVPLLTEAEVGNLWHQHITKLPYEASAAEFIAGVRAGVGSVAVRHKASVVLNQPAQQPVAAQSRFIGEKEWRWASVEHHNLVQATPHEWPGYETRLLYAAPAKTVGTAQQAESTKPAERAYRSIKADPPPIGVRLNLLTTHGAHTQGVLSPLNMSDFLGWEHLAKTPPGMIT